MAVSKRLRYEILRRDNHTCRYCGAKAPDAPLRVDHVVPVALGGSDEPSNLVTACEPCNSGKSSATADHAVVADVADDALRWSAAMQQAAANLSAQEGPKLEYRAAFLREWNRWGIGDGDDRKSIDLPGDWKTSIERFRAAGLPVVVWDEIVDTSMANEKVLNPNKFKYCCGIAWRMVEGLHEEAKRLLGGDDPAESEPVDLLVQAAVDVWERAHYGEDVDEHKRELVRASAIEARERLDPHRIIQGAEYAAWIDAADVREIVEDLDRQSALHAWNNAWYIRTGEWPDDKRREMVREQCNTLLAAGANISRVVLAATYAGSQWSARLYYGLDEGELAAIKQSWMHTQTVEIWTSAFHAVADRWPSQDERLALHKSLERIGTDPEILVADVLAAAVAAGAYQDPDLTTSLPRHRSALEIAAQPLAPAA